jgi:hypothetical protein
MKIEVRLEPEQTRDATHESHFGESLRNSAAGLAWIFIHFGFLSTLGPDIGFVFLSASCPREAGLSRSQH